MIDISNLVEKMVSQNKGINKNNNSINRNNFKFLYVIGKGGFGRVWKIQSKKLKNIYALKEMSKLKIIDKKSEKSINSEREFLSKLHHPFIVNMHYAFQDKENLYLVMDMLSGGDLRYHISRYRKFSEEQTRFFISNMIYALKYIHENNVIHRDIKPENLVLDENGYVRITDFGIAKENMPDNSSETSGTPGYMAPEVMKAKNHSFPVDFFAIGVIGYEFMLGKRPYYGKNRQEIKEQMLTKEAIIKEENIPKGWSTDSVDFINQLLKRKIGERLGSKEGARELMKHPWLKYYPWEELIKKNLSSPFVPDKRDNFDKNYCEGIDRISEETKLRYEEIYCSSHFKKVFLSFYYNKDEDENYKDISKNINYNSIIIDLGLFNDNDELNKVLNNTENRENNDLDLISNKEQKLKGEIDLEQGLTNKNDKITKNNYDINGENKNKGKITKNNTKKEDPTLSSINFNKRVIESNIKNSNNNFIKNSNNKTNGNKSKLKNNKRPLSHSNSTQEIISTKNIINMRKYQKNKINNQNSNIQSQIKQSMKNQKVTSKYNSNIPSNSGISQKGTGASISTNNYYSNEIFSAIYNNFIPHQIYSKFNNNNNLKKKASRQRASSVISTKNKNNKNYLNKNKKNNQNKNNNNINKTTHNNTLKKYRTNSTNQLNFKSSEYEYISKIQKWK